MKYGLKRVSPDQVNTFWPLFDKAARNTFTELDDAELERTCYELQRSMVGNWAQGWVAWEQGAERKHVRAVILGEPNTDRYTNRTSFLVYLLYGFDNLSDEEWANGLKALITYCSIKGYDNIVAYTENFRIIEQAEKFVKGTARKRVLEIPIEESD